MTENAPKKFAKTFGNINNAGLAVIISSSLAMFGLPVGFITGVLVAFYGLQAQIKSCIILLVIAMIPSFIAVFMMDNDISIHIFTQTVSYILLLGFISYLLREFSSWSVVLQAVGVIGAFMIIGIYILYPDVDAWWLERLQAMFTTAELEQAEESLAIYAKYATGIQVMSLSFSALFNLFLARYWQAIIYNKKAKVRQECMQIQISGVSVIFILFLTACTLLQFPWALDALIVSLVPAFFAGVALFHMLVDKNIRKANRIFAIIMFYMMNLIAFPFVPLAVSLIGLADYLMQLRLRFGLIIK